MITSITKVTITVKTDIGDDDAAGFINQLLDLPYVLEADNPDGTGLFAVVVDVPKAKEHFWSQGRGDIAYTLGCVCNAFTNRAIYFKE